MVAGARDCERMLEGVCGRLPEVSQRPGGEHGRHVAFMVRNKTFTYFTDDHHGDGRLALICKAPLGEQPALVATDPDQYFVPPYLGHRGWIGYWLDTAAVDWATAEELMTDAYRLTAPKGLIRCMRPT